MHYRSRGRGLGAPFALKSFQPLTALHLHKPSLCAITDLLHPLNTTEHLLPSSPSPPLHKAGALFALYAFWSTQVELGSGGEGWEKVWVEMDVGELFSTCSLSEYRGGKSAEGGARAN